MSRALVPAASLRASDSTFNEPLPTDLHRVGIVAWQTSDGIAEAIGDELATLGHQPVLVSSALPFPRNLDVIISHGPHGHFLAIASQMAHRSHGDRPIFAHWNTEGLPDLRIAWPLMHSLATMRSRLGMLNAPGSWWGRKLEELRMRSWFDARMHRFRYLGDYDYAYRKGWIDVFADSSTIYAELRSQHGMPTVVAHWGATKRWCADLHLDRDIDVLWMGCWGTKRRQQMLQQVVDGLRAQGVRVHVADNVESPFVFDEQRTHLLNRAKITLNLTRTWYDDNYSRFALAAPNRSLVVSEPLLPHCPPCKAGAHYVSAPIPRIVDTILYYLEHEEERQQMVECAYELCATTLSFQNSVRKIMRAVDQVRGTD
jgi:hypothetical protein